MFQPTRNTQSSLQKLSQELGQEPWGVLAAPGLRRATSLSSLLDFLNAAHVMPVVCLEE